MKESTRMLLGKAWLLLPTWGSRIRRLYLCRGVKAHNECVGYEIKPSDGKAPVLELWEIWSTPSLPLLRSPLRPRVVTPDRILFMSQIEQTVRKQMTDVKLWRLYCNTWNHLILSERVQAHLRMLSTKCVYKS